MAQNPSTLAKGSSPESVKESDCKACQPYALHPCAAERRKMVVESMEAQLKKQVHNDFKELQELYKTTGSSKKAFFKWGVQHVTQQYPGLGETTAYSVPYCFIGNMDIENISQSGMFRHIQESQIRADVAWNSVGLALGLLNNKREKEAQKHNAQTGIYPFVIIGAIFNEHILQWPERLHDMYPEIIPSCPDMAKQADKIFTPYYCTPAIQERGEIDILVLDRQAHVVFFEVKSYGLYKGSKTKKNETNRWQEAYDQLKKALGNFKQMFPEKEFSNIKIRRVIAMPNILLKDAKEDFQEINHHNLEEEMVYMLTKENMIRKDYEKPEAEFDISDFEKWWNANLTPNPELMGLDLMRTVIARYIGTLSRPCGMSLNQQRNQIRTPCDAIELSAFVFKSLCYFFKEKERAETVEKLLECLPDEKNKKMHIKGPPGSGRTTMTIVKARNFLKRESQDTQLKHVIVVDICRGGRGRPVGLHVFNSILKHHEQFNDRVHYLPLDANSNISEEQFAEKVTDIIGKYKIETQNLMFILDEILPIRFWSGILCALDQDKYKKSLVWCTDGLAPGDLGSHQKNFHLLQMRSITRIPPTVQKVMYHVDWCANKLQRYQPDEYDALKQHPEHGSSAQSTENMTMVNTDVCWSTRGPIPLCIRHSQHDRPDLQHPPLGEESDKLQQDNQGLCILNCTQCAENLAYLLTEKLSLIDKSAASDHAKAILPCAIAILFSIPSSKYTDTNDDHVEITTGNCEDYAAVIQSCHFMECLKERLSPYIEVFTKVEEDENRKDVEQEAFWNKIIVCWVDKFQGLVKDVVIYLPSEMPLGLSKTETDKKKSDTETEDKKTNTETENKKSVKAKRKLPWPGTAMDPKREEYIKSQSETIAECMKSQSDSTTESTKNKHESTPSTTGQATKASAGEQEKDYIDRRRQPAPITAEAAQGGHTDPQKKHGGEEDRTLAHMYWRTEDIERYTEWDQTNLMFAASRCTSQLILVVP